MAFNNMDGDDGDHQSNKGSVSAKRSKLDDGNDDDHDHPSNQQQGGIQWNVDDESMAGNGSSSVGRRKREESERVNHILLFTILNPMYPITTDVIHTITSAHGQVLRIVVFKKHGVQAMVEFDSIDSAKRAKEILHGADIYSGCCTLKIDFAKPSKLNVYKNDGDSWDYTNPNLGPNAKDGPIPNSRQHSCPLLQEPRFGAAPIPFHPHNNHHHHSQGSAPSPTSHHYRTAVPAQPVMHDPMATRSYSNGPPHQYDNRYDTTYVQSPRANGPPPPGNSTGSSSMSSSTYQSYHHHPHYERFPGQPKEPPMDYNSTYHPRVSGGSSSGMRSSPGPIVSGGNSSSDMASTRSSGIHPEHHQGAVMMVYGLSNERMNAERLFNIFCLYGNVVRVKFLKSKEGCAMIQMGDGLSVDRGMANFNNTYMFGNKVQLGYSKQAFLSDVQQPHTLVDGTPSFCDFMGNKNNRFLNPEMASKNRIQPPTKTLHFFNTPPNITEEEMRQVFKEYDLISSADGNKNGNEGDKHINYKPQSINNPIVPKTIKFFQSKSERSSSGLIEFETLTEAVEALAIMNHHPIKSQGGKFPFIMKLCFSSSRNPHHQQATSLQQQ